MSEQTNHSEFGELERLSDQWCWAGRLLQAGKYIEIRLNAFAFDEVPQWRVSSVTAGHILGTKTAQLRADEIQLCVAKWMSENLREWYWRETQLDASRMEQRLCLTSIVVSSSGEATLWFDEPFLEETGHSISASIGLDVEPIHIELAG